MHTITKKEYIVITGAGKGIGREVASHLYAKGHHIIAVSRSADSLDELEKQVSQFKDHSFIKIQCDVSNHSELLSKVNELPEQEIKIRALIINAGWGEWYSATSTPIDEWQGMINSNLNGAFISLQAFYSRFNRTDNFQVIALSSDSAYHAYSNRAAYCTSKAGLSMFIDCVREELRAQKYRVTELVPSRVDTNFRNKTPGSRKDSLKPGDIASVIEWLLGVDNEIEIRKLELSSINSTFGR